MNGSLKRIGFIGVGGIGRPMAERLIRQGFDLIICDRRDSALEPFRALGARVVHQASECACADIVIVMVVDDAQVLAVTTGTGGLIDGVNPDCPPLLAIMSTVLPRTVEDIAAAMAFKKVRMIDAPVSGGPIAAAKGTLSIMAGGTEQDFLAMKSGLEALGSHIFHCGALGAGEAIKILNNAMGITTQFLMTEILDMARAFDIDEILLTSIMEESSGRNFCTRDLAAQKAFFRYNIADPSLLGSLLDACRKDLRLASRLAEQADVDTPLLAAITAAHRTTPDESILASWKAITTGCA
ncbi:MAG: NAD(P)-dependent oxidoreductase [Rhodobiaceae bacterium]|nr:NAD(P)-dependent oxidoreductase [Rhodobiaceae bacterium]